MSDVIARLQSALKSFDRTELDWVAETFASTNYVEKPSALSKLLSEVEKKKPDTVVKAISAVSALGSFQPFAMACLARHAGLVEDVEHEGLLGKLPSGITGNLTVNGPIVCEWNQRLIVAGNVKAHSLVTAGDVIILGDATFRDGVFGIGSYNTSMNVRGSLVAPAIIGVDYDIVASENIEDLEVLELSEAGELLAAELSEKIEEWQDQGGPQDVIPRLRKLLEKGSPIFRQE